MVEIKLIASPRHERFARAIAAGDDALEAMIGEDWVVLWGTRIEIDRATFDEKIGIGAISSDDLWRTLALRRKGFIVEASDERLIIEDEGPAPAYSLRFDSQAQKDEMEKWVEALNYDSIRRYILDAIEAYNRRWRELTAG